MTDFYVYAFLRHDGSPYYIGKGHGYRIWKRTQRKIKAPKNKSLIVKLETNLTELGAFALERRYIRWYGRKDNNTGILRNLTDGGEGTSGFLRPDLSLRNKQHKRNQFGSNNHTFGKISITNGIDKKFINEEDENYYVNIGYYRGSLKGWSSPKPKTHGANVSKSRQGRIWITNGNSMTFVPEAELSKYELIGFRRGRKLNNKKIIKRTVNGQSNQD